MKAEPFPQRPCPGCGGIASTPEVRSDPPAESLSFEELRRYWSGSLSGRVFFSYRRCGTCGLLFNRAFFSRAQLADLYSALAPNMHVVPSDALAATQRGYFNAAAKGAELTGGYLELGPDVGRIARDAAHEGRFDHFWLVEPNRSVHPRLAAACENRPHTILSDLDDLSSVPDGSIGLAAMIHVFDHLLDPSATLNAVHAKLRPGGRLLVVTHDEASLLRRVMGKRWPPFCLQHPELYNARSITGLLHRAGYARARVGRSRNYFPIDLLVRRAAAIAGLDVSRAPLPKKVIGLRLGNMITLAHR